MINASELLKHPLTKVVANLEVRIKSIREDQQVILSVIAKDLNFNLEDLLSIIGLAGINND